VAETPIRCAGNVGRSPSGGPRGTSPVQELLLEGWDLFGLHQAGAQKYPGCGHPAPAVCYQCSRHKLGQALQQANVNVQPKSFEVQNTIKA
jgi:hypothetical protein